MSSLMDCMRAGMLTLAILATTAAGIVGVALWPADAAQSEARVWIRSVGRAASRCARSIRSTNARGRRGKPGAHAVDRGFERTPEDELPLSPHPMVG